MKYIRTKDGRIFYAKKKSKKDVKIANNNLHWKAIPKGCNNYFTLDYRDDEIIKIADTIEELCDEFVLFREGKPYAIVPNKEHNAELAKDVWKDYRGAIWTDKGLIYVAKMNEKGKLELL